MPIQVFVADEQSARPVEAGRLSDLARAVLCDRGVGGGASAELNVLLVDEETMAAMNRRFLGRLGPTDVLSFPIEDDVFRRDTLPLLLGDVVICPEVAWRNAPRHTGTYEDELALLLVHGILHLLGMDHENDADAEEMEALERELLARYHVPAGPCACEK